MAFDVEGARKAGYSDSEIADHLAKQSNFDVHGARKSGYTDDQIVAHLATPSGIEKMPAPQGFGAKLESAISQVPRQFGLTARYGIEGTAAAGGMLVDPFLSLAGQKTTAQRGTNIADLLKLPKPETSQERIVGDASRLMAGTGLTAGLAGVAAPGQGANTVSRGVLETMASRPGAQVVSAGAAGAAGGAARETGGGPGAQFVASILGGLAGGAGVAGATSLKDKASQWLRASRMQPVELDAKISATIQPILERSGMTWGDLSSDVKSLLRRDVQQALVTGGTLDDAAVQRLAEYRIVGATPTVGSITLDPVAITRERNLAKIGANSQDPILQSAATRQNQNMQRIAGAMDDLGAAQSQGSYRTGQSLLDMITGRDAAMRTQENALYSQARDTSGRSLDLDREGFVLDAYNRLAASNKGAFLPDGVGKLLEQIRTGSVKINGQDIQTPFNVDVIDNLKTTLSAASRSTQDGNARAAIAAVRDALENVQPSAVGKPVGGNQIVSPSLLSQAQGQADNMAADALRAFDEARAFARNRRNWQESAPAITAALEDVPPDAFVQRYILGQGREASAENVRRLVNELDNAGLRPVVKNYIAEWIKNKATGQIEGDAATDVTRFSEAGVKAALKQIGNEKLRLFFSPEEITRLNAVRRVAGYETVQPTGAAVNNSNTAASLLGPALDLVQNSRLISRIPFGDTLRGAAANWTNQINLKAANDIPRGLLSTNLVPQQRGPLIPASGLLMLPGVMEQ